MRSIRRGLGVLLCVIGAFGAREDELRPRISVDRLRDDIKKLTAPEMGGRGASTQGLEKAGTWLASQFRHIGLKPPGGDSYQQQFTITTSAKMGTANLLSCTGCDTHNLETSKDFVPLSLSASGSVTAPVVFAGYGISASECGYDDYAGIDVRGRIALILRHEPGEYDSKSVFDGRVYTEHSQTMKKVMTAREHGAAGLLIVNDTAAHSGAETLEAVTALPGPGGADIPVAQIHSGVVEKWFATVGRDFHAIQREIESSVEPRSFVLSDIQATLRTDVTSTQTPVFNVVAYLPGTTDEYIVVGAHYDHLGLGEQFSLAQDKAGTVHPGADDNASGTAGLIAMARWLAVHPPMRRGVLFIAFSAEEIGLLGSTHYAAHPLLPIGKAVAMFNLDMIGRLRDRKLTIGGVASGEGLRSMLDQLGKKLSLDLQMDEDAVYGSSDHTAFKARSIPVLFFFTGLHADYHRPSDTPDKIDAKATAKVVELAGAAVVELAQRTTRVGFVRPDGKAPLVGGH